MANNYEDGTGLLVFDGPAKITPVILGLFGPFGLDSAVGESSEAYIRSSSEEVSPTWRDIHESLLTALAPEASWTDDDDLYEVLKKEGTKRGGEFGVALAGEADSAEERDGMDYAGISEVFDLALSLNDGHNLLRLDFEGNFSCSKPRLFEFGGYGIYESRSVSVVMNSSAARRIGALIERAIESDDGATALAREINSLVAGAVRNDKARDGLRKRLAACLLEIHDDASA